MSPIASGTSSRQSHGWHGRRARSSCASPRWTTATADSASRKKRWANAGGASPADRRFEECGADAAAAVRGGDHEAEVGDVGARGMLVARDRQAPDDGTLVLGDEDGGVRVASDRPQVAPLVGDVAPA